MRRKSPYFTKSKAAKEKENYEATSDLTSQDIFYTTESNETQYEFSDKWKKYFYNDISTDTNTSRYFSKYDSKDFGNNFTTSAISYEEAKQRPKLLTSPESKSEQIYSRRRSPYDWQSTNRDHPNFRPKDSRRRRSKPRRSPERQTNYSFRDDVENYSRMDRRPHSPRRREDYIHEEPDEFHDYEKYFEPAKLRDRSPHKHRKLERFDDGASQKRKRKYSPIRGRNYQVFAYHESKQNEGFKGKDNFNGDTIERAEIEINSHEYPVLAFKDNEPELHKHSEKVYVPVLVVDKKTKKYRGKVTQGETITQSHLGNYQVLAANLQEQQNIFQKLGENSSQRTQRGSNSEEIKRASVSEQNPEISSGLRHAGSLLGSIFDKAPFSPKSTKEQFSFETTRNQDIFKATNVPFTYQVNVDITSDTKNVFDREKSRGGTIAALDEIGFRQIESDPLRDDYPVTKDYIKVNDDISEQKKKSMLSKGKMSQEMRKSSGKRSIINPPPLELVSDKKLQSLTASKVIDPKQSVVKKNLSQAISEDVRSQSKNQDSKNGSMAITSKLQSATNLEAKGTQGTTRLSTINEEKVQQNADTKRSTIMATLSRGLSASRKSKEGSTKGTSPQETEAARKSEASQRRSNRQGSSKVLMRQDSKATNSRKTLPFLESEVVRKSLAENKSIQRGSSQIMLQQDSRVKGSVPFLKDLEPQRQTSNAAQRLSRQQSVALKDSQALPVVESKTISDKELKEFKEQVFQRDSAVENRENKGKLSKIGRDTQLSVVPNTITEAPPQMLLTNGRESQEDRKLGANGQPELVRQESKERITSIIDLQDVQEKVPLQRVKSKRSVKNLASALIRIGSRSKSRTKSIDKEDEKSLFLQNVEPTSKRPKENRPNLDKKELKQKKAEERTASKIGSEKSISNLSQKKSKSKLSRFFSKSKSKAQEGGDSKTERKPKETKSILRLLRRSKSSQDTNRHARSQSHFEEETSPEGPHEEEETPIEIIQREERTIQPMKAEEKPCECFNGYVKHARECGFFFLGTTLHQQVMNILKMI